MIRRSELILDKRESIDESRGTTFYALFKIIQVDTSCFSSYVSYGFHCQTAQKMLSFLNLIQACTDFKGQLASRFDFVQSYKIDLMIRIVYNYSNEFWINLKPF